MSHYARVFQSGNSQAVRLPKEFRLDVDRVEVFREGDAIILRPDTKAMLRWASLHAAIKRGFSSDFMENGRQQPDDQERPGLELGHAVTRYLLDTNTVIALVGNKSEALIRRIEGVQPGSLGICSVVAHELWFGAYKSRKIEHNLETLRLLFGDIPIIEFDREDARAAGEIRAMLSGSGTPIGPYDVLIAGQAKRRNAVLITNNLREFQRVDGLRVEDWTVSA